MAAARQRFFDEGFDAVSMEAIAATAGISKGTLYARYCSKEELLSAVLDATIQDWSSVSARNDHLLTEDIGDRLRHHARTIASSLTAPEVIAVRGLLFSNRERFPAAVRMMHDRGYRYIVELIAREIDEAGQRDARPPEDAIGVAMRLVNAILGWHSSEGGVRDISPAELQAYADRTVALLVAARSAW